MIFQTHWTALWSSCRCWEDLHDIPFLSGTSLGEIPEDTGKPHRLCRSPLFSYLLTVPHLWSTAPSSRDMDAISPITPWCQQLCVTRSVKLPCVEVKPSSCNHARNLSEGWHHHFFTLFIWHSVLSKQRLSQQLYWSPVYLMLLYSMLLFDIIFGLNISLIHLLFCLVTSRRLVCCTDHNRTAVMNTTNCPRSP